MLATAGVTPVMGRVYAARETGRSGSGAKMALKSESYAGLQQGIRFGSAARIDRLRGGFILLAGRWPSVRGATSESEVGAAHSCHAEHGEAQ